MDSMNHRPDERPCAPEPYGCGLYKHHSRFRSYRTHHGRNQLISASLSFSPICRDCEQRHRNEKKNEDRPRAIIERRAKYAALKAGTSFSFFWVEMNYQSLVPQLAALMQPSVVCQCCARPFTSESDIQIEHILPRRHAKDWPRLHARNVRLMCKACNNTKGKKDFAKWLDDEDLARQSNKQPDPQFALLLQLRQ